jgi:hypothetical protein
MSAEHPGPTDDRFTAAYTALVDDLINTLDLASGAADATQPAAYYALADDLSTVLHLDAGLTRITGGQIPPAQRLRGPERVSNRLGSLTDAERLSLRNDWTFRLLRSTVILECDLAHAYDIAHVLACVREHEVEVARGRADELAVVLARETDLYVDQEIGLNFASSRGIDLGGGLSRARNLAHDITRYLTPARTGTRGHTLPRVRATALELTQVLTYARNLAHDLVNSHARGIDLDPLEEPTHLAALLESVGDNFVGADLSTAATAELTLNDLRGIQWSSSTSWPPGWADPIRAASIEIEPGILKIVGAGGKRSLTPLGT